MFRKLINCQWLLVLPRYQLTAEYLFLMGLFCRCGILWLLTWESTCRQRNFETWRQCCLLHIDAQNAYLELLRNCTVHTCFVIVIVKETVTWTGHIAVYSVQFTLCMFQPMRHRKGSTEKTLQSRPLACAVLGMINTLCSWQQLWWLSGGKTRDYQNCSVLYCVLKVVQSHKHT